MKWNRPSGAKAATTGTPEVFEFELDVFIQLQEGERDEAARRRLNTGYNRGAGLENDIRGFSMI